MCHLNNVVEFQVYINNECFYIDGLRTKLLSTKYKATIAVRRFKIIRVQSLMAVGIRIPQECSNMWTYSVMKWLGKFFKRQIFLSVNEIKIKLY